MSIAGPQDDGRTVIDWAGLAIVQVLADRVALRAGDDAPERVRRGWESVDEALRRLSDASATALIARAQAAGDVQLADTMAALGEGWQGDVLSLAAVAEHLTGRARRDDTTQLVAELGVLDQEQLAVRFVAHHQHDVLVDLGPTAAEGRLAGQLAPSVTPLVAGSEVVIATSNGSDRLVRVTLVVDGAVQAHADVQHVRGRLGSVTSPGGDRGGAASSQLAEQLQRHLAARAEVLVQWWAERCEVIRRRAAWWAVFELGRVGRLAAEHAARG